MKYQRKTTGIASTDKVTNDIYRILELLDMGVVRVSAQSESGVPIYLNHSLVPIPEAGYVKEYYIYNDYDFKYMLWPDGSRHNRRLPLSFEVDE